MSDLTAAINAASEALNDGPMAMATGRRAAEAAVAAAAPHIRAAERERIARMLERLADLACTGVENGTLRCAARLARSIPPEDIPGALAERQT